MATDQEGRDRAAELGEPEAGERGIPFDAVCVGCKRVRVKRSNEVDPENPTSFKHSCKKCKRVTWWNPVSVLTGLMRQNGHPAVGSIDE